MSQITTTRITELSSLISTQTTLIDNYFRQNGLATPLLEPDALHVLPIPDEAADILSARTEVIAACSELQALLTGPRELVRFEWTAYASVKAILRFKLDRSFPVGENTSFEAMAKSSGLHAKTVRRIVRHAIINHRFFQEKTPGIITHSALTAALAQDKNARDSLLVNLDEFWPAIVKMADAMEKWPNSEEGNETVAVGIAERFANMTCTVQDFPDIVAEGALKLPALLKNRVIFMSHDFFAPQPVVADVYYFRFVFHNWSDKYCIKILHGLIPALRPGATILLHERILPGAESLGNARDAKRAINVDIGMQALLNARERELHEWADLFQSADSRFCYVGARRSPEDGLWIIEAEWLG
ncbi:S-adenosyl-L-methionine-dependent methyltransferase [Xylariaceae sp. FL0255]|nr:S-adenosyl-L-methionine-dependent methyltransferase [Xylariaceae sp. FL0255]